MTHRGRRHRTGHDHPVGGDVEALGRRSARRHVRHYTHRADWIADQPLRFAGQTGR